MKDNENKNSNDFSRDFKLFKKDTRAAKDQLGEDSDV